MRNLILILIQSILISSYSFGQFQDFPERFDCKKSQIKSVFIYETTNKNDTLNRRLKIFNSEGKLIHQEFDFYDVHSGSDYLSIDYNYNDNNLIEKEILKGETSNSEFIRTYEYIDRLLHYKRTSDGYYWKNEYDKQNRLAFEGLFNDSNSLNQGTIYRFQANSIYEKYLTGDEVWSYKNKYYSDYNKLKQELLYNEDSVLICKTDFIYDNKNLIEEQYFENDSLTQTTKYYYDLKDSLLCEIKLNTNNIINTIRICKYDKDGRLYEEDFYCDRFDFKRQLFYNSKGDIDKQIYFTRNIQNREKRYVYTYFE
jgi:hypothetical protein